MPAPRRQLIRPPTTAHPVSCINQRKVQKLRDNLARERTNLTRWLSKLRRASNAFVKSQKRIARLEKQLASLLDGNS
jgi:septal ring factor EnvC (AmiA/AmiB activator)